MNVKYLKITAPKKSTRVGIDADLLQQAEVLKIDLSQVLETWLAEVVRDKQRLQWLTENQEAMDDYHDHVERNAVFSDEHRQF